MIETITNLILPILKDLGINLGVLALIILVGFVFKWIFKPKKRYITRIFIFLFTIPVVILLKIDLLISNSIDIETLFSSFGMYALASIGFYSTLSKTVIKKYFNL